MATYSEYFNCPECNKNQEVEFYYSWPDNGDTYDETVTCDCGCEFKCEIEAVIEVDFESKEPEVLKSGKMAVTFDINDISTWPESKNPNQLTLL